MVLNCLCCCQFHILALLARSDSKLTSETMNPYRHFSRTPWTGDRPIAMSLSTQYSITQKNADTHPYLEQDSNPRSQYLISPSYACPRQRGHRDKNVYMYVCKYVCIYLSDTDERYDVDTRWKSEQWLKFEYSKRNKVQKSRLVVLHVWN
jgi:hypothetical protein